MDLIRRIISLKESEAENAWQRFEKWLIKSCKTSLKSITYKNRIFFVTLVNSSEFNDIILENSTEWYFIYSEDQNFKSLCKIIDYDGNLVDEKRYPKISASIWILKSNLDNFKISKPTQIYSPQNFENHTQKIDVDFLELLKKLDNGKIKLIEVTGNNKISQNQTQRIR